MEHKKTTRLSFTEEDLESPKVEKAAGKAEKAANRADKAKERLPTKRKLRWEREDAENTLREERTANPTQPTGKAGESHPADGAAGKKKAQRKQVQKEHSAKENAGRKKPTSHAPQSESSQAKVRKKKLHFEEVEGKPPSAAGRRLTHTPVEAVSGKVHQEINRGNEDGNVGVDAAHFTEETAEGAIHAADRAVYSHKLKKFKKAETLERKADTANVNALYQKSLKDNPQAASNPISRWQQKRTIKKEYAAMKARNSAAGAGKTAAGAAKGAQKAGEGAKTVTEKMMEFAGTHSHILLLILAAALLLLVISGMFSSCSTMIGGTGNVILGTSFTAEDADIKGADEDYTALETALRNQINNIERTHSGYDEYRYNLVEIGHNPYELAALLTVQFEDYTRAEVQGELQRIFDAQYELTLREEVEIRTRTVHTTSTDPETGETTHDSYEEEYEYYILNITLTNTGIRAVAQNFGLNADQLERYDILLETRGNRDDLFGDVSFAVSGGEYTDYDIPGEALTDEKFRKMITEAEKYLGYPYVWGGSSPSTSFDCSGFVSYVINHCGNGWSVGRQTANGLMSCCSIIPKSEAKPGDLIFFQGTYNTSGASHVGIYVGNNMMIHCGNPISYASIETSYWQSHFYCIGRLP